jgi:hypothetical protein
VDGGVIYLLNMVSLENAGKVITPPPTPKKEGNKDGDDTEEQDETDKVPD